MRTVDYKKVKEASTTYSAVIVDVRNPDELEEVGGIPSSINIPLPELGSAIKLPDDEFKERYSAGKPSKKEKVYLSCKLGKRAATATEVLLQAGYDAYCYEGSYADWNNREKSAQ